MKFFKVHAKKLIFIAIVFAHAIMIPAAQQQQMCPELPNELVGHIVSFLNKVEDDYSLARVSRVSKVWRVESKRYLRQRTNIFLQNWRENSLNCTLQWAAKHDMPLTVTELISRGADVNSVVGDLDTTPLLCAAKNGYHHIVKLLIAAGAMVDQADKEGRTPLFSAAQNGHQHIVELLIRYNADHEIANNDEITPCCIAKERNHKDVVSYLEWLATVKRVKEVGELFISILYFCLIFK